MPRIARKIILEKFAAMIARGQPIVGGGAGTGLSAKCEEEGGIDLIVIYNSGRYRMAGRGSLAGLLAYGNANDVVVDMAQEVLPVVRHTPVLAGVNGTDPFMIRDAFLRRLAGLGFSGIQNFPSVGLIDGVFRANLEETGMGFGPEIDLVRAAHELDLLTTPYVFEAEQARDMTEGGRRRRRLPHGPDHGRRDRRADRADARRLRGADQRLGRRGPPHAQGRGRALPWRPDRPAGGRGLHHRPLPRLPRLLRRLQHGAPADRGGDRRADAAIQAHRAAARGRAGRWVVTGSQERRRSRESRGMRI